MAQQGQGKPGTLAELKARRDAADKAAAERKAREDAALARYASAVKAGGAVDAKLAKDLEALAAKAEQLRAAAVQRRVSIEADAGDSLADLTELGRSVEEVAGWVGLSVKRVRRMIKDSRGEVETKGSAVAAPGPEGRPAVSVPAAAVAGVTAPPPVRDQPEGHPSGAASAGTVSK
jgi:hypothetical protein